MTALDTLAPNYRRAQQRWTEAPLLAKAIGGLDACLEGNAHGLAEHVKAFVECICRTIIVEFGRTIRSSTPTTTELLAAALEPLGLTHPRKSTGLGKLITGFNSVAEALNDMRNLDGPIAHGRDGFLDEISRDHARAFLHAGDAILGLLLGGLEGKQPDLRATRQPYESFQHLNELIDNAVTVEAHIDQDHDRPVVVLSVFATNGDEPIELRIEPSRLLYGTDRDAYIEVLGEVTGTQSIAREKQT